eukprot:scaffold266_cov391-Prasinococcus_capsulatus_cf.AAC.27
MDGMTNAPLRIVNPSITICFLARWGTMGTGGRRCRTSIATFSVTVSLCARSMRFSTKVD